MFLASPSCFGFAPKSLQAISPPPAARDKTVLPEVLLLPQSLGRSELSLWPLCLRGNEGEPVRPPGCHAADAEDLPLPVSARPWAQCLSSLLNSGPKWLIICPPPNSTGGRLAQIPCPEETSPSIFCFPAGHSGLPCPQQAPEPVPAAAPGWRREPVHQQVELWLQSNWAAVVETSPPPLGSWQQLGGGAEGSPGEQR